MSSSVARLFIYLVGTVALGLSLAMVDFDRHSDQHSVPTVTALSEEEMAVEYRPIDGVVAVGLSDEVSVVSHQQ